MKGFNLENFVGAKVQQLALGIYEFQLVLNTDSSISISGSCQIRQGDAQEFVVKADKPSDTSKLYFLLGLKIISAELNSGVFTCVFEDQTMLALKPSGSDVETYVIWDKGDFISF